MFDLTGFIKENLINGFANGSFAKEQVNIFSVNYMTKGLLTEEDIIEIDTAINTIIAEKEEAD